MVIITICWSYATRSGEGPEGGEDFMRQLSAALGSYGYTMFDGSMVPAGGNWMEYWATKAHGSKAVIPILSPAYFNSKPCMAELQYAPYAGVQLFPVLGEQYDKASIPKACDMILFDRCRFNTIRTRF